MLVIEAAPDGPAAAPEGDAVTVTVEAVLPGAVTVTVAVAPLQTVVGQDEELLAGPMGPTDGQTGHAGQLGAAEGMLGEAGADDEAGAEGAAGTEEEAGAEGAADDEGAMGAEEEAGALGAGKTVTNWV